MKQQIISKLKENGVKVTPQRIAIIDYLEKNYTHPTAEEIYGYIIKDFPTISLATVYNTLDKLEEIDKVKKLRISDENKVNYEYHLTPHHHFYCKKCNKIYDIDCDDKKIEINECNGHRVEEIHTYYKGTCKDCL